MDIIAAYRRQKVRAIKINIVQEFMIGTAVEINIVS